MNNMNQYSSALLSSMTASAMAAMADSVNAAMAANPQSWGGVRRTEVAGFPRGWVREETPKMSNFNGSGSNGVSNSKNSSGYDVVYYTPMGQKVRTKTEMSRMLGDNYDLTAFDFNTGKINPNFIRGYGSSTTASAIPAPAHSSLSSAGGSRNRTHMGGGGSKQSMPTSRDQQHLKQQQQQQLQQQQSKSNKDTNETAVQKQGNPNTGVRTDTLVPPIRQTASIFKQPVTVVRNPEHMEVDPTSKAKPEMKQTTSEKPRQLFWEKRLSGLRASYPDELYEEFKLPYQLRPVGPGVENDVVLASISTNFHMNSGSKIEGQPIPKNMNGDKDLALFMNPEQPLIQATKISQSDVDRQEARVMETRKKLAEAIAALDG